MKLKTVIEVAIRPALSLLPNKMHSEDAIRLMLAIGLQESRFLHRRQIRGPARGFYQFENGGGVRGVMEHHASIAHASHVIIELQYPHNRDTIHEALADNDILAACFARLLLWTDPRPLPKDADTGWNYYLDNWRPGKPHPETWSEMWHRASNAVREVN